MLEKTYDAAAVEPKIAERWEEAGAFKAGAGSKPAPIHLLWLFLRRM